jgi:hypothetical protein
VEAGRELIMIRRAAVATVGDGHPLGGVLLASLSTSLHASFHHTGDRRALREAVMTGRAAVAAIPAEFPSRSWHHARLGAVLHCLHDVTGDQGALTEAIEVCAEVVAATSALPADRVAAGRELIRMYLATARAGAALATAEEVVDLLSGVATRAMRRQDREFRLGDIMGVASQVAAAALAAGQPRRALELAEEARGRLLAEAMDSREELTRLRTFSAELASELERIEDEFAELDTALEGVARADGSQIGLSVPVPLVSEPATARLAMVRELADRRAKTEAKRVAWIQRVRAAPRLADFQRAPSVSRLQEAGCAPVVTLIVEASHGDALILTPDAAEPVIHLPLPGITAGEVTKQVTRFRNARQIAQDDAASLRTRRNAQHAMMDILAWAWGAITDPVLTALGYTVTPREESAREWPRVWWCPTGTLAYLPLHAAGHHADAATGAVNPRTVLDRVVSSYALTIRSLGYARRSATAGQAADRRGSLIVAPTEVPGVAPLHRVAEEARTIARLMPGSTVINGPAATRDAVLAALAEHRVAHLACHGVSDWTTPQSSRLVLADHATAPLTVADIAALRLDADLAFLSACETTEAPARLTDEMVHITSAFQLAGFRQVIGTLWPINDSAACEIATKIYAVMTGNGTGPPDTGGAAAALHTVIREYRDIWAPTRWAAHVHVGA